MRFTAAALISTMASWGILAPARRFLVVQFVNLAVAVEPYRFKKISLANNFFVIKRRSACQRRSKHRPAQPSILGLVRTDETRSSITVGRQPRHRGKGCAAPQVPSRWDC